MTIDEVARLADVSKSTVSRTFSRPETVNSATRERVLRTARQVGYLPHAKARAADELRNRSIGLFVPDIANPFFPPLIKAVQARAWQRQCAVLLSDSDEHTDDEAAIVAAMAQRVDGLVLASPRMSADALAQVGESIPLVTVSRRLPGSNMAVVHSPDGYFQAIEHLKVLGHRRVLYLAGPAGTYSNEQRKEALGKAAVENGIELIEIGPFEPRYEEGEGAVDVVIALGVTAVVAYNDLIALALVTQLQRRGLIVGSDVSVVGIDDIWLSRIGTPSLTTVHVPIAESGALAVSMLMDALDTPNYRRESPVQLPTRLVVRATTGPAPS